MNAISPTNFEAAYDHFNELIIASSGHPFHGFDEGLAATWENYKPRLREHALSLLEPISWQETEIGTGTILERAISAVEIQDTRLNLMNNLVFWQNRFGHASRAHRCFLEARADPVLCSEIEEVLFDLFIREKPEGTTFERLADLADRKYPLVAYLFFLKDSHRFMPIHPTGFDRAFVELGIESKTLRQCSWANYSSYNATLDELRPRIEVAAGVSSVELLDAHSFCWILYSLFKKGREGTLERSSKNQDSGRVLGSREKSIYEMRSSTENTVLQSNGQSSEHTVKNKELRMSSNQLEKHLNDLLDLQENSCALTGIRFEYRAPNIDESLLPSLDRIDSDGHYEEGNLQVVCRFINFWKSNTENSEFKRLLMLVRGGEHDE